MNIHRTYMNRLITLLTIIMMGVSSAMADTWDGTTKTAPDMSTNNGTSEALAIQITKAAELAWLGDQMKSGNTANGKTYGGKYWKLTADIDLGGNSDFTGNDWASIIGNDTKAFCGYFNGDGHTVSNIQVASVTSAKYYGLFPSIQGASTTNVSTVKNLKINGVYFKATASIGKTTRIGALAGYAKQAKVSGIAISNVKFLYTGGITDENDLGGAIGCAEATVSIESVSVSTVKADFTGSTTNLYVAGLVGKINSLTTVSNCSTSDVTITYNTIANASRISGLIGYTKGAAGAPIKINGCMVTNTKVDLKAGINNGSYIGALIAQTADNTLLGDGTDANKNTISSPDINISGDIKAASYISGAIGDHAGNTTDRTSVVKKLVVTSPKIKINNYSAGTSLTGGVFGRVSTYTAVDGVELTGASLSFTKDLGVAQQIGTFAGTITGNATQQISVKNVTIDKSELTFGSSNTSKTVGLKAGVIGQVSTNVLLDTWKVTGNSSVTIKGNLATTASQIGGFIGYAKGAGSAPLAINNIEIGGKSSVSVSGNVAVGSYIGGVLGQADQDNADNVKTTISNVEVKDATTITIGGNIAGGSYLGGFAGYIYGRNRLNCSSVIEHVTLPSSSVTLTGSITASSYVGGLVGRVGNALCKLNDCNITTACTVSIGDITTASSYIGGAIGQIDGNSGYNAGIDGITLNKTAVTVNKVANKDCYIGGVFGRINTYCDVIKNVSVSNPSLTYKYTENPNVALNIGSFAGGIFGVAAQKLDITDVTVDGTAQLTIGETAKAATTNVSQIKAGLVGQSTTNVSYDNWKVSNSDVTINGNLATSTSYIGGFMGYAASAASAPLSVKNITLGSDTTKVSISVNGNITVASHIGGVIGNLTGVASSSSSAIALKVTKPAIAINGNVTNTLYLGGLIGNQKYSTLKKSSVTGGDITISGNNTTALYVGGAVGYMDPTATDYAVVQQVEVKKTKIHSSGAHTYARSNKPLVVGGVVGYMGQSATTFTEVRNCVADSMDIDFSSFVPEAGNTNGNLYHQQQNAFVIGGVIGRINTPSRLPESLFFTGKINAPFATVAPVVGVFNTSIGDAKYLYDDYVGANAAYLTTSEWEKASTWYYSNYKIGLSQALLDETARTKNYASAGVVTEDGIKYINVKDDTFSKSNVINGIDKSSYTVLAYNQTGKDVDFGIFPAWNTNATTYPAYYMYFMQGVNHGQYVSDAIEQLKKDILEGMGALIDLVLVDNNGDFTIAANRGVVDHKMKVTPSGEVDSYKWYVDGNLQSETSDAFTYHPSPKGNDILVEAYKDGVCRKRVRYTIKSVLRVKDVSAAIYGTKVNPYLIGNAEDLQLLSYLSSLPATIAWDTKGYKSNDHYNRAYYELDKDIDMSSVDDFTPISFPSANSTDGNYGGYNQNIVFEGVFDGKFHTIKNLRETWHSGSFDINDMNVGWGLFSYVGNSSQNDKVGDTKNSKLPAKICNLFIDGAVLTHKANNTSFAYNGTEVANNCMVGVLAGIVSSNTIVENIEIRNSKITDDGSWEYSLATKGLYVGGAIGSIQAAFNATGNSPANTKVDHIAANVDISLNNAAFADNGAVDQLGQFNVGGIVGRYVATSHNQTQIQPSLPAYVFYSGDITAPKAWISPVLAALRYKDNNAVNTVANYSKQWEGNNNTEATQIAITNAHYYNFKIEGKKVTDFYPENTCPWNARSITYHENGAGNTETYSAKMYQGVNLGTLWVDEEGCSLKTLNENIVDGIYWVWDNGFVHMSETPCIEAYLTFKENEEGTGADVTAVMTDESTGSYRWMQSFDGENWFEVEGITENIYSSVYINKPKVVVAYVTVNGVEYRTQPLLLQAVNVLYSPYLTTTGNETDGYWYNVAWNGKAPTNSFVVSYQWFESDEKTQFVGQTDSKLYLGKKAVDDAGGVVWCKINIQYMGADVNKYFVKSYPVDATVVFVDGTNGIDNVAGSRERGWKPETPVKTIDHANSLLKTIDEHGTWDNNIIVVMGTLNPNPTLNNKDTYRPFQSRGSNPATITGNYNSVDYGGKIILAQWNPNNSTDENNTTQGNNENEVNPVWIKARGANCYVLADTKFENLTFEANIQTDGNNFIECHGHDVTFGKGLVVTGFQKLSQAHGNFKKAAIVPELTIVLTATNLNQVDIDKYTKNRTKPQVVTFQSGHYGRILGGRYTNEFFSKATNTSHSILASAENPIWAIVNIDIDPENSNEGEIYDPDTRKIVNTYSHDINAVIAGLTDGSMYGDYTINYHGGSVSYIVGGNQGNPVANGTLSFKPDDGIEGAWGQWPNASYFGRTVINVEQDPMCKNISVGNLYAGGLGREANGSNAKSIVDMYYYGHTEVNIKSGTVGNVYAGGAGGVMGINPWDAHLPYATETEGTVEAKAIMNKVQYGDTRRGTWSSMVNGTAPIAKVTLHNLNETGNGYDTEILKLDSTYTTVNIIGGTVNGNVYGGGYGFVQDMPAEVTMQGVGSVFGDTYINITGGAVSGSVYGGSQGHSQFYNKENKYGQTITHIAEMNGIVNINITGNDEQCPTIGGNIYGGGQGLVSNNGEEYLRIATCGNTELGEQYKAGVNITIDLPENVPFAGNIYGGGQLGMVEGNTNILIKRGTFTGNIFGGGRGEDNHPNKAKVIGTTNVKIGE